ncbi:hypothetical protein Rhow_005688 [Rhodococcus wratislaviensis]|uniref:Uncharacterized protein n=1 Tax=Rhodococcus wratislaviensis TaxID=44752 RepID=A0A402CEP7_RHOWR|nr:hypothetical protein Rhow_005688 [Rhodococcus wratislaviensis]
MSGHHTLQRSSRTRGRSGAIRSAVVGRSDRGSAEAGAWRDGELPFVCDQRNGATRSMLGTAARIFGPGAQTLVWPTRNDRSKYCPRNMPFTEMVK